MNELAEYLGYFEATQTVTPSQSGLLKVSVSEAQATLRALGWPSTKASTDGAYGPGTKSAWEKYSTQRRLNPAFDRANPKEAWVHPATLSALKASGGTSTPAAIQRTPAKTAPAPMPSGMDAANFPSKTVQNILLGLGYGIKVDGVWGSKSEQALKSAAAANRLAYGTSMKSGGTVTVAPSDLVPKLTDIYLARKAAGKPAAKTVTAARPAATSAPVTRSGAAVKSIAELQALLIGIGFKKTAATTDGLYGATTKSYWAQAANTRKLPSFFDRVTGATASVSAATYEKIKGDAQARQTAPVTPALSSGAVVKDIAELQALLIGIGFKKTAATSDGLYGPTMKSYWAQAANTRRLPTFFDRVTGTTASVSSAAYAKILSDVHTAPVPVSGSGQAPPPWPAEAISKSVAEIQGVLVRLGGPKTKDYTDGSYGAKTAAAWGKAAQAKGLDGRIWRVDGKNARVIGETFSRLNVAASSGGGAEVKATTAQISVQNLQAGLNGRGTKPLLDVDGAWGGHTEAALMAWLKSQGQDVKFTLSGDKKKVALSRLLAESLAEAAKNAPTPPPRVTISADIVRKGLATAQYKIGAGSLIDAATKNALDAFVKKEDYGVNTGYRIAANKKQIERLRKNVADKLVGLATGKPVPEDKTTIPIQQPDQLQKDADKVAEQCTVTMLVLTIQQAALLTKKHPKIKTTGKWDKATEAGWLEILYTQTQYHPLWIKTLPKILSTDRKKIRAMPIHAESWGKMAKMYIDILNKGGGKVLTPDTQGDKTTDLQQQMDMIKRNATTKVLVKTLQEALVRSEYRDVKITGKWGDTTRIGLLDIIPYGEGQRLKAAWAKVLPGLISADKKSVKLWPDTAKNIEKTASDYRYAQAHKNEYPITGEPDIHGCKGAQSWCAQLGRCVAIGSDEWKNCRTPTPSPAPAPGPGPGPSPEPSPFPGPAPEPVPDQPAVPAEAISAWDRLTQALQSIGAFGQKINDAVDQASKGPGLSKDAAQLYANWVQASRQVLDRAATLIESAPQLQQAIDATGPSAGLESLYGMPGSLGEYFAELSAASATVVGMLREPFPTIEIKAMEGLGQAVFGPLWSKLVQLLGTRTVATLGGAAIVSQGVVSVLNGEVDSYLAYNEQIAKLVAEGKLSGEAGANMVVQPPQKTSMVVPIVAGVVVLGGIALFLNSKKKKQK